MTANEALRKASDDFPVGVRVRDLYNNREGVTVLATPSSGSLYDGAAAVNPRRYDRGFGGPYIYFRYDDGEGHVNNRVPDSLVRVDEQPKAKLPSAEQVYTQKYEVTVTVAVNPIN